MHPFLLPGVPSYVVFLVLAFSVGYLDALRRAEDRGIERKIVERTYLAFLFGALAGARLFHVVFEDASYYATAPSRVLAFWQGGFSLWGGAVGGIGAACLAARGLGASRRALLDLYAPSLLLGVAIGRIGCFLAGCCFGLPTSVPWAVTFVHPATFVDFPETPLHPTQLYESAGALVLSVALRFVEGAPGKRFALALAGYGLLRFVVEFFRGDVARGFVVEDLLSIPQACALLAAATATLLALKKGHTPLGAQKSRSKTTPG